MLSLSRFTESTSPTPHGYPQLSATFRPELLRLACPLSHKKAAHPAPTFFPQPHTRLPSQLHTQLFTRLIPSTSSITHSFYSFTPLIYTTYFLHHSPSTLAFDFATLFRPQPPISTSTSASTALLTTCIKHYQQSLKARIIFFRTHVLTSSRRLPLRPVNVKPPVVDFLFFTNTSYHPLCYCFFPFLYFSSLLFTLLHLPLPFLSSAAP